MITFWAKVINVVGCGVIHAPFISKPYVKEIYNGYQRSKMETKSFY